MQLISGFIDTYLRLNAEEEELFQAEIDRIDPPQKEIAMEIVTSWMEKGIEKGIEQGIEQGKQSEARSLIMRLLTRRIGTVEPQLQKRIHKLTLTQLEDLAVALLDLSSVADLEAWLQQVSN